MFPQVRSGARFLGGLGALRVILAQLGASLNFVKAMAWLGLEALGFLWPG
ncbi:hypothetical protein GCM10007071_07140 [Marinobacter zhanjiangensis]|uniref:Uncharacterized protein n=1 Tax=Marinobacter zhanjiangensis TaxID=578215 RepID=A0ABQ3ANS9_9GAMM|nr:hypothetical protein GCM10007071_07140 [Marinobacter zhanjiangensis]